MNKSKILLPVLYVAFFLFSCKNVTKHHGINYINNTNNNRPVTEEDKKYQYSLHPVIGKKYYYTINTETHTKLEVNDKKIETGNKSEIAFTYEMLKDSANNLIIKLTYNKLYFLIQKDGAEDNVIDTDNAPAKQTTIENLLSTIKGSSIVLTLNTKGDILNTSGSKEISDKIMAAMAMDNLETKELVQQMLSKLTGEGFIQDNLKEGLKLFPDTVVYIGDSWNRTSAQSLEIDFEAASKYTLASITDNIAEIEAVGEIHSSKNVTANIMGQQVLTDLNGELAGKYKLDITTGMLQYGKTNYSTKGTILVLNKEIPISIKIKKEIILN